MISVEARFRDRIAEVDHFFNLLQAMDEALLSRANAWKQGRKRLPRVLAAERSLKLLKATSFLLLYNTVEATVRDAVESIWTAVGASGATTLELLPELRKVWVGSEFRRKDAFSASGETYRDVALNLISSIAEQRVPSVIFKRVISVGSINNVSIRDMCVAHGVAFLAPKNTRDGIDLDTVKGRRNVLAHGEQSFEEIGSAYTLSDLKSIKVRSIAYLRQYVRKVDRYIATNSFRAA